MLCEFSKSDLLLKEEAIDYFGMALGDTVSSSRHLLLPLPHPSTQLGLVHHCAPAGVIDVANAVSGGGAACYSSSILVGRLRAV